MASLEEKIVGHAEKINLLYLAHRQNKLPHALLFLGPESSGKKKVAFSLAQNLVCETPKVSLKACGLCGSCLRVEKNQSENVRLISPQGAAIKVEQIREVLDYLSLANFNKNRIIIVDQAHLMNPQAANSLLKTLEEPRPNIFFILIGPEESHFMPTIKSRSQILRFSRLTSDELKQIKPGLEDWVYACARGQVARVDQLTESDGKAFRDQSFSLLKQFLSEEDFLMSSTYKNMIKDRESAVLIFQFWSTVFRDLLMIKAQAENLILNTDYLEHIKNFYFLTTDQLGQLVINCMQSEKDLLANADTSLVLESFWVKYVRQ